MRRTHKRFGSLLLVMAMLLTMLPVSAMAADTTVTSFGGLKDAVQSAGSGDTITISGTIKLDGDLEIPEGKELTLKGESDAAKLATSGQNTILVKGNLTIQNLQVGGKMDKGFAPITLVQSGAELHTDGMILVNEGASENGYTVSAQGIQIAEAKGSSNAGPERCVIELKNSEIQVNGAGARGICFAGASDGTTITLDNTKILNGSNPLNEWLGGYSRGLALFNASNMTVNIQNNSQIAGFQYAINSGRDGATSGLRIFVNDSDIRGWTTFNVWTDGGVFSVENSTLTGMNGEYNGDKTYSFSAFVINSDIYNNGWGIAENNQVILKDTTVNAITEDDQPVETLLRIDVDSTEVEFQGTVTFTDNTNGAAGAVLDIGNMDDPVAFMDRHANLTDGVTVNTPNGNPLLPVYEVKNTFSDGQVSFGESFKTFISGVDYENAAENNEKVILLRNVSEPEFAVNSEEGHGNKYGGWTLDLAGHTLTLNEWSGDKITVIDSSAEKTGDIIVDGESVLAARNGEKCYTSISDAIASVGDGDTIQVLKDIPDAVGISVPSGKNFTIDFDGHTYTLTGPGAGSTNTETNGFQLLKDSTITMKNGTIRIAENANNIKRIIQNYADLTLENMQIYAENQVGGEDYALSFNNGNIIFKGTTSVIASSSSNIAFDVCKFSTYPDAIVTFDESYTGTVNGQIVYDSPNESTHQLIIKGNGIFGTITATGGATEAAKNGITISGGHFAQPVNPDYLDESLNTQLVSASNPEAPYSYYTSVSNAIAAAKPGDVVTPIPTDPATKTYTVTLDYNDGRTGNVTCTVEEDTSISLPRPTRSGYNFLGWYAGGTKVSSPYQVTGNATLVAQWSYIDQGGTTEPIGDYLVNVDRTTGGKVTVTPGRADKGDTVTITVKPNDGYVLDELTVTAKDGGSVKLTWKDDNKYTFTMPGSQVSIQATFVKDSGQTVDLPFADVAESDWYYDAVQYVYENELMNGTSASTFSPFVTTSRAMILTILARYDGVDTSAGSTWYEAGAVWAIAEGVSDGTNLEADLTREQLVTMLWRYAGSPAAAGDLSGYPDGASVSDWAAEAMLWAVDSGIITGNEAGALNPQGTATRAEVATILMRYLEN